MAVTISLSPEREAFLRERVESGRYHDPSDVVSQALLLLEQQEDDLGEAFVDLKSGIDEGIAEADRGELLDGEDVMREMREMLDERRRALAVRH